MRERLPCPVCLGTRMEKPRVGDPPAVEIDHCARCGGVWLEYGEVQRLRARPPAELWKVVARRSTEARPPCHGCRAPLPRGAERCPSCGRKNTIECPSCEREMLRETRGGITLDVCRSCKGAWFDHVELEAVWSMQAALAVQRRPAAAGVAEGAGDVLLDVFLFAPDLAIYGTAHAVSAAVQVAAHVPELAGAAPEATVAVIEAAGDAAGGIFDVIAAIFEGLFGLLDF